MAFFTNEEPFTTAHQINQNNWHGRIQFNYKLRRRAFRLDFIHFDFEK